MLNVACEVAEIFQYSNNRATPADEALLHQLWTSSDGHILMGGLKWSM